MEELAWLKEQASVLQDWLRLLLLSWAISVPALWKFSTASSEALYHVALITFGGIGIPLLWIRTRAADRQARAANEQARIANVQAKTAEQGHITDRFTKAVEQLGSEKMAVRLGAIYALERLSKDSPEDHWTIMEVLTAYVRDNAPWPPKPDPTRLFHNPDLDEEPKEWDWDKFHDKIRPPTDIQAILTVLGRRDERARKRDAAEGRRLKLPATDLRGVFLREAHLEGVLLHGAHLERANLLKAHLEGADLVEAHLEQALLFDVHLELALLMKAHLEGALLQDASLRWSKLWEVHLEGALLHAAT